MKNLKNFAATVAMLLCCITASAYDFEVEGLGYTITSADELTVSVAQGATAPTGDLVIPSTVTNEEVTYNVTAIAANAFSGCSELTSITISTNITTIGSSAFSGCSGVKEVTIEDATVALSLGTEPFASCSLEKVYLGRDLTYSTGSSSFAPFNNQTALTSVTIGDKVTVIGEFAFYGCSGLLSLTIPASVTTIGYGAFSGCSGIKELTIEDGAETLSLAASQFASCPLEKVYLGRDLTYSVSSSYTHYAPFYNQTALSSLTIGDKVTVIGEYAFYGCSGLLSLTIPPSVTTIGGGAFTGCTAIKELTIEDGSEAFVIGEYAFYGCSGLLSLTIPPSVTTIGGGAFTGCTAIKELTIEDGSEALSLALSQFASCPLEKLYLGRDLTYNSAGSSSSGPFCNQTALTSLTIGDKVTVIGERAFSGCSGLTSLTIPASVITIGSSPFSGCSGVKELTFEDGSNVLALGDQGTSSLFGSCPLEKLYLGRNLDYTYETAYIGGNKGTPFYKQINLTSVVIGDEVTAIGDEAFSGCSGLTSLTMGDAVTTIGKYAFQNCSKLSEVNVKSIESWLNIDFADYYSSNPIHYSKGFYIDGKLVTAVEVPSTVTEVKDYAFYNNTALLSVDLGDAVTTIGERAFSGCTGLASLTMGDAVTTIGQYAFSDCSSLASLTMGDAVTTIGHYAFQNCTSLTSLTLGNAVTTIGSSAFGGCSSLVSLTMGDAVTTIGQYAFQKCTGLTSLTLSDAVTTIGHNAFSDCSSLASLTMGDAVTTIGHYAFQNCTSLTSLTLSDAVTTIGQCAFQNCTGLASLTMGDAVSSIGSNAFSGCSKLKDLHIGNLDAWAAIEYGDQCSHPNYYATNIYHNDKLVTEVEIPTTVTTIPDYTFYNFGDVVKVKLHEGVESIGNYAFGNVPAVFEVAATAVPTLGTSAIAAPSVVVVPQEAGTVYGEADGWVDLAITTDDAYKQTLTLEAVEDASALHKTLGDAKLDSVVDLTISGTINSYDFMVMRTKMTKLRNLDLTNATVKYNAYQHYTGYHTADSIVPGFAFYNCNLFDVKLPSNTKSVESYAVNKNIYLRGVELPTGMTTIGSYAFAEDSRLREVTIPEGVKTVGYCAFASCSKLDNMMFPTTLEDLRGRAFASTPLSKVDFSKTNLTNIGEYAFRYCTSLEEVKLPSKTLQAIYVYAFQNCTSLKEFRIPSSVRSISNNAFTGCTNLEKVYVYTVEPISIGQNTFALTGNNFVGALYAPRVSYYTYWYDTQWGQFQSVNEFDDPYEYAYFEGDTTLDPSTGTVDGDGETLPDADMGSQSGNTVNGAEATEEEEEEGGETPAAANGMRRTQAATAATLTQEWGTLNVAHNGTDGASIIAKNGGAVTAETANFRITVAEGQWYFLSFPFDIKKENIKCESGANYVFRYYDGAVRAANGSGGWTNVAVADDGTYLKAGKGYIFQASKSDVLVLTVEDMSIVSEDKSTAVEAYAADNTANASWNFVGNPYLSYYNVTAADYSAPITVWNGSSYQAVRPGDDEYQLAPFEAFFVQKPEGVNDITYATTSQTTYQKIQAAAAAAAPGRRTAEVNPDRLLVNITLTDGATTDQTRVVFNNSVSMEYEMECDAAKFSTAGVPQLYTIDSRAVKYAINERPVAEGIVTVGFTAPVQGNYTIAAPRMDTPMLLRDNATGTIHDFSEGSYEFASEAGTFDDRFTLMMKAGETSIDELESTANGQQSTIIYDVAGRRVNEATEQGIYVKGNRKVVTL